MIIARRKRKENIAEYLLYMWQVEDLIRANNFDMDSIRRTVVDRYDQPDDIKEEIAKWYEELIEMMRSEGVMEKGHIQLNKNVIIALTDLHLRLLKSPKEMVYGAAYYKTLPFIVQLRAKSGGEDLPELETCFNAIYGFLMLKMQGKEISPETMEGIKQISSFLALLAEKYREDMNGELKLEEYDKMKTILVTGANGQLGNSIRRLAAGYPQYAFVFTDVDTLDICDAQAVNAFVKEKQVDYIINCAAYTAVDKAEDDEALCLRINRDAVRNLGEAARMAGARVIHVSTDYVFDGTNHLPYVETDNTCPASVYGRTKLAGEQALQEVCPDAVIIRTAWLYSEFGNNFVKTMLRLGNEREQLSVVFDQIGSPTYAGDLAAAIFAVLVQAEADAFVPGIYHYSNEGVCSWYDFAVKIMELGNAPCRVLPIESKDYPAKAARPHFSVLNKAKIKTIYKISISHWEASLRECMKRITK